MLLFKKSTINNLSLFLLIAFFLSLLLESLVTGGRWDLNEQIAFAQRLSEGINSYANGQTDLFFPSSPYFPGVGYLSYIYSSIGFDNIYFNEILMLSTAVLIGLIYCVMLQKLTLKLYPNISKTVIFTFSVILFATCFRSYFDYMKEFKPDTILLLIGLISFFIFEKNKKPSIIDLLVVGVLLFIAFLFKQSSFIIFILVYILVLKNLFFSFKEKFLILLSYSLLGILAIIFVFKTNNLYYYTIDAMSQHPMLDTSSIIYCFGSSFVYNIIICISILYFFVKKKINLNIKSSETVYLIFSIVWFLFSVASAVKLGGNRGNIEVGLLVFIPFVIFAINDFLKSIFQKKYFNFFVVVILISGISGYSFKLIKQANNFRTKLNEDQASINFLKNEFSGKNVFVDGDTYVIAKASGLNILTEAETVGHFNNIPNYDMSKLKNAIDDKIYDLFILKGDLSYYKDIEIRNKIDNNYKIYENENLPIHLYGKVLTLK
jgi:hypothetical protein